MIDDVKAEAEAKMKKALDALKRDFQSMRTGRASPSLVEPIKVDYYGAPTPLQQIATVSVPEARQIAIKPYDASTIKAIEKAIQSSELGLTPTNDGKIIRLTLPPLTQERRRDMTKLVKKRTEEAHIAIRNIRHQGLKDLEEMEGENLITEDQHKRGKDLLQKLTDQYIAEADTMGKNKEAEVMEV